MSAARIDRAAFDVTVDGRTELVTVAVRSGELVCTSTDGDNEGPHVTAALRILAGQPLLAPARVVASPEHALEASFDPLLGRDPDGPRLTPTGILPRGAPEMSLPPAGIRTLQTSDRPAAIDREGLAEALEDLVTAIVRLGIHRAQGSPSLEEAFERLVGAAPPPLPLGMARWMGRLRAALGTVDVDQVAELLDGATRLSADLRRAPPSEEGRVRIVGWLGPTAERSDEVETLYDRTFVEIGREWVAGIERASIERRYLVELASGEIFREERARLTAGISVGPCPRHVTVGLAEAGEGPPPRRIRLLQYTVTSEIRPEVYERLEELAVRSHRSLVETYQGALAEFPGLVEPFALMAPTHSDATAPRLDGEGWPLPIVRADEGEAEWLDATAARHPIAWIAGRLVDAERALLLSPVSALVHDEGFPRLLRVR